MNRIHMFASITYYSIVEYLINVLKGRHYFSNFPKEIRKLLIYSSEYISANY